MSSKQSVSSKALSKVEAEKEHVKEKAAIDEQEKDLELQELVLQEVEMKKKRELEELEVKKKREEILLKGKRKELDHQRKESDFRKKKNQLLVSNASSIVVSEEELRSQSCSR